jgi:hypothetical protein
VGEVAEKADLVERDKAHGGGGGEGQADHGAAVAEVCSVTAAQGSIDLGSPRFPR